jgi:hypothetical protein
VAREGWFCITIPSLAIYLPANNYFDIKQRFAVKGPLLLPNGTRREALGAREKKAAAPEMDDWNIGFIGMVLKMLS